MTSPFVILVIMYGFVLGGAVLILYWAFKGNFNASGRLFLLSEVRRIPVIITISATHIAPEIKTGIVYFISNGCVLASEVTFALSLHALPRDERGKYYCKIILGAFAVAATTEKIRLYSAFLSLGLYAIYVAIISSSALWICLKTNDARLRKATFWKILTYIEALFVAMGIMRIAVQASGTTLTPMLGGTQSLILFAAWLALLVFRYISYQSIWMTWTSPNAKENSFKKDLLTSLRQRNILLQQLVTSNRRAGVSALASSLAHQLSQPLTGASLQAEVEKHLLRQRNKVAVIHVIETVTALGGNISQVVRNLRSLFVSNDEKLEEADLGSLCHDVIKLIELSSKIKGIAIRTSGHTRFKIYANTIQIQQVILNVIDNAIEASEGVKNAAVEIILSEGDGRASLTVRDHGPGFPSDILDNPFRMYQESKKGGMGIGLWLCREIVDKHNGFITASNHVDGGACCRIDLPTIRS